MDLRTLVLDVNETLFSLEPLRQRFQDVGLGADAVPGWFAKVLRDGFALAATEEAAPFPAIARHHLRSLLGQTDGSDGDAAEHVLGGFGEVTPQPDVAEGLRAARDAGMQIVTLTNGTEEVTRSFLDRAGLSEHVERVLEARESGVWKPHARAYRWAAEQVGREPAQLLLVAVHPWDVHGAVRAGLAAAWLDRDGADYPDHFAPPTFEAATLTGMVEQAAAARAR